MSLAGSAVCSDAFFPFADGLVAAAKAGATAAIQPGGSVRDAEVIAAADEHNMAMVFTGDAPFSPLISDSEPVDDRDLAETQGRQADPSQPFRATPGRIAGRG